MRASQLQKERKKKKYGAAKGKRKRIKERSEKADDGRLHAKQKLADDKRAREGTKRKPESPGRVSLRQIRPAFRPVM